MKGWNGRDLITPWQYVAWSIGALLFVVVAGEAGRRLGMFQAAMDTSGQSRALADFLVADAARHQAKLPQQVSEGVTLYSVSASGTMVTHKYRIDVIDAGVDEAIANRVIGITICSTEKGRQLLATGVTVRYQYFDLKDRLLISKDVTKNDCPAAPK